MLLHWEVLVMRKLLRKMRRTAKDGEGYTHKQMAEILGVSQQQYQRIEYGMVGTKMENWDKLEDLFGVSQRELRKNEE